MTVAGGGGHDPNMPTAGVINKHRPSTPASDGIDPELVIAGRKGDVLIKHTVLKADHFPSCHNTKLTPILEGAPNYRKVDGLPVCGVAIPTVTGLRQVIAAITAQAGVRKVYWQNLREEPLIFINGNPFVVREADQPFSNLEYTGINRTRVEDMEVRLKADILSEAALFGNRILVVHENEDLSLFDHWEPVTPADVQTPQEVYEELKADGYAVDYLRIPVTDEKAPKDDDFQELIDRLWAVPSDAAVIFNCQMGRGRTTTGMVIASLLYLRRMAAFPLKRGRKDVRPEVPGWFKTGTASLTTGKPFAPTGLEVAPLDERLKGGNYGAVRSLLRALDKGPEAKAVLDCVIDACAAMQNLREGIFSYRARFLKEAREKQRNVLLNVCLEYLERYYMLIAFTGYLSSPSFEPGVQGHVPFPAWMAARPELRSILMRLLRRNSMAALELHTRSPELLGSPLSSGPPPLSPGVGQLVVGSPGAGGQFSPGSTYGSTGGEGDRAERDVVATRNGAVLGAYSILKEDWFPGMCSTKIEQRIDGAPNFRSIPGLPVYGVGMPTVEGITGVLREVAGGGSDAASRHLRALWVNMREEPVVYINGRPFVLREEVRPLKNMMEYEGIDGARLEAMEERLKKDVLAEALRHGGRILVAHESFEYGHYGQLYDTWEEIDHPDAVATPADVYHSLTKQGFQVNYFRLPVTDGAAPLLSDFDSLVQALDTTTPEHPVIFNCQMGIGRTTTGMVIASLVHVYRAGKLEETRSQPSFLDTAGDVDPVALRGAILSGLSPRSEVEEEEEGAGPGELDYRDAEDERPARVWDLSPQQLEEQRALAAGGYVGVRRVVRLLEEGEQAKKALDCLLDAAGTLINLRVAIMRYRKPRSSYKFLRPELQQRGAAFKKGSSYLERYVLLIVFTYYLEHVGTDTQSFSAWMHSRPDLMSALGAVHANPGAALAPLPLPRLPALQEGEEGGMVRDQTRVLARRRGRLLTRRTILKSYLFASPPPLTGQPVLPSAPDLRCALDGLPIYAVGSLTMDGLRSLLLYLGAGPGGHTRVVISDIREELVVYVNGVPFTRREMEMPAAALHHAGVHAGQLEEQEGLLRDDVVEEVMAWGGRILLHKEVEAGAPVLKHILSNTPNSLHLGTSSSSTGGAPIPGGVGSWDGGMPARRVDSVVRRLDDMTGLVDSNPGSQVVAFWEHVDLDSAVSVMTPRELVQQLMEGEGYQASYARIPLSRERTPEASDIQQLHTQVLTAQEAAFRSDTRTTTLHLVLARTASGSSSRFVSGALAVYYIRPARASLTGAPLLPPGGPVLEEGPSSPPARTPFGSMLAMADGVPDLTGTSPGATGLPVLLPRMSGLAVSGPPSVPPSLSLDTGVGEYRGIMALCRLLPGGLEAKLTVDRALSLVRPIGDLLRDIARCKEAAGASPLEPMSSDPEGVLRASLAHTAARQLGTHYLKRYFLLITYRCFLEQFGLRRAGYAQWVGEQKELEHLLSHLNLD